MIASMLWSHGPSVEVRTRRLWLAAMLSSAPRHRDILQGGTSPNPMEGFLSHRATPKSSSIFMGFSGDNLSSCWGYPHDELETSIAGGFIAGKINGQRWNSSACATHFMLLVRAAGWALLFGRENVLGSCTVHHSGWEDMFKGCHPRVQINHDTV